MSVNIPTPQARASPDGKRRTPLDGPRMDSDDISTAIRRRPAVMADVGRLAGVSHQTVSRVINGSPHVREETRQRVIAAMRELDYRPNSAARALVTGRSSTLGVVSFDTTLYGPASTLFGIERAAHAAGYFVIVASLEALDRDSVCDAVERLRLHGVDGILMIAPLQEAVDALRELPSDLPMVAVEAGAADSMPVAAVDQHAGAVAATRHLLELGHVTVWHVAGPPDWLEARQRLAGWRDALVEGDAFAPPPLTGDWSASSGYSLGRALSRDRDVSAVFVANDQMALGVLRALHEAGRRIPRDVSVVGFDDIPEAQFFTPPLTTIRQDFGELGRRGVRLLLRAMAAGAQWVQEPPVVPELIVRSSTAVTAGTGAIRV
ncbi:MAG: LacI family DNA-binding transcriptional regulator [Solirubrobacterales bacterium]|nr:LacI family DNA-binding transcriptional regulator [Solirubrobacterales bacterium]